MIEEEVKEEIKEEMETHAGPEEGKFVSLYCVVWEKNNYKKQLWKNVKTSLSKHKVICDRISQEKLLPINQKKKKGYKTVCLRFSGVLRLSLMKDLNIHFKGMLHFSFWMFRCVWYL